MAAHTKIIDLFGLPACGKTTLAKNFCEKFGVGGVKVITLSQLVNVARYDRFRLLKAMPYKHFVEGLKLRWQAPFDKKHLEIHLMNWPSHARYYWYAKKYTDYDIVIADHGDIQDFVSLERGVDLHKKKSFSEGCSKYLDMSLADMYVYCGIAPEEALVRMKSRGREFGRIDVTSDEKKLQALKDEKDRFDFFVNMLQKKQKIFIELEMTNPTDHNVQILMKKIRIIE
jgi:thymidylate kinase